MDHSQLHSIGDEDLFDFLMNAPKTFREGERIKKFQLKNGDYIHCVLWNYHFYITGTDIVKILIWRFQNAGRQIGAIKKFEEGVFSDLRNLKPGVDATLENPRSDFLEFLYKNGCIRTQKKQKVFYWYSVPHDALFCDAMERDLRRDTSLYTYNTFVQDPRKVGMGDPLVRNNTMHYQNNTMPMYQKHQAPINNAFNNSSLFNKGQEHSKRELFNISDTLFGSSTNDKPKDGFMFIPPVKMQQKNVPTSVRQMFGLQNVLFPENLTSPKREAVPETKPQRSRSAVDPKYEFDEFDLEQFGFLKDRCKEQFGFGKDNCELKLFKEDKKDDNNKSIDHRGEVRFIGNQNKGKIE